MFKAISEIMAHSYEMWNSIVIAIKFCNAKKMICALTLMISNHYRIKCLSNLLQIEPCNVMFKVISDIMAHWYDTLNYICYCINFSKAKKMIWALMFILSNHDGIKCLSNLLQLEPSNVMWFPTEWHIGMMCEIQLILQLISAMQIKWFVYWCYHKQSSWNKML